MALSQAWIYTLGSVILVSLISLIGVLTLSLNAKKLNTLLIYLISFSAGALIGDSFLHLLPESLETTPALKISTFIIVGITLFFILEKVIHWQHCHGHVIDQDHVHPYAFMNLVGDAFHNFLDGIIIAASYLISLPVGIATTVAVVLHEIPQEIGDFAVLLHGGFKKTKALFLNFVTAAFSILGAVLTLLLTNVLENIETILVPIAIGGFLYIAGSDLIPQLHKDSEKISHSLLQLLAFIIGILIMAALLLIE